MQGEEDLQTQEAFEDYSAMSSIPEDRINRTPLSEEEKRELLRDSAKFVAEMTPIVGDVMSAREVWEELQKDEPNYLLVGALAGATAIGLIPGIGDAAAQAIRTGARKGLDFARRIEVDPNALGSTGGNIRLRPEDQATPARSLNITPPAPLNSLEELLDYNNRVRQPRGMLERDTVRPGDNILYRPDRGYRAIGPEGYQDFLESGFVRAVSGSRKNYETPYFMRGQSSSRYVRPEGEDYIVEAPLDTSWRGAADANDKYVGPGSNEAITRDSPIRVFRRNEDGSYSVVFDNIGDKALLPSGTSGFAEGGVVSMEEQMSLFEMGGLTDDGAMRDPVSGNEVPPGSMATEVRDDVPSMLSEGEYVVPADVVRYYGVKFFEDLRMGAKSGLNQMEQTGRIGGEPVDSTPGDEPLSPEEMQMLAEITGMYGGGMVRQGYQEGGMVAQPFVPTPNYNIPGFSLFQPVQSTSAQTPVVTTSVTLYGPNGEIANLTLPTDKTRYDELLGQGYSTQQQVRQPTVQGGDNVLGGFDEKDFVFDTDGETSGFLSQEKFDALNSDPLGFGQSLLDKQDYSRIAGGLGATAFGPIGGLITGGIAAAVTANNVAQVKAAINIAESRGLDATGLKTNLEEYIKDLPNAARLMSQSVTGKKVETMFNNQLTQSALTPTPTTTAGTAVRTGGGTSRAPSTSQMPAPAPGRGGGTGTGGMPRGDSAADVGADDRARAGGGGGGMPRGDSAADVEADDRARAGDGGRASPGASGIGAPGSGGIGKGAGPDGRDVFGPMAKGGLVTRPNKNKSLAKKK